MYPKLGIIVVFTAFYLSEANDYCKISCFGSSQHTMCMYKKSGPASQCNGYIKTSLTEEDKKNIVHFHNSLRNKVAQGLEYPQPPAANMLQLKWDDELAKIAQRWADQCSPGHDTCRDSKRFYVGQNYAASFSTSSSFDMKPTLKKMVDMWFGEVKDFQPNQVNKFTGSGKGGAVVGHYTQMAWAQTKRVGCGFTVTKEGQWVKTTLICNYGPGGNMFGAPMYIKGNRCSQCPGKTKCSKQYVGLCN